MSDERTGWGGQFWLHNGTALTKLVGVTGIGFPDDQADEAEVTTLEAPGKRKQYIRTLIDGGEFEVEMNYIPASATDTLCQAARDEGDVRDWKIVVPDVDGAPAREVSGTAFVKMYSRSDLTPGEPLTATLTLRVTGAVIEGVPA